MDWSKRKGRPQSPTTFFNTEDPYQSMALINSKDRMYDSPEREEHNKNF